jgi:adenylate kinase family enzyme
VKRVVILGPPGAGKSRLARELAEILERPVVHLDRLYWRPGWVPTPDAEWAELQRREVERDSWIADGLQEERVMPRLWLDRADTIVFIDVPPLACIWRIARRRLDSTPGPEGPVDCKPAPLYLAFPKVLRFVFQYHRTVRDEVLAELARREQRQRIAILRKDEEIERFVEDAKAQQAAVGESVVT